jgi:hypothetical protein
MPLPFRRPFAGVGPGHISALARVPRAVPAPGQPAGTALAPVVPPWLVPGRSGVGSAYAAARLHRQ